MASNLRVDNIQPSTAMGIGIGTANGSVTFNADVTGGLNVTTGSVGIGTTPEAFHSNNKGVIRGDGGYFILGRNTNDSLYIAQNYYYDSSDAGRYIVDGEASIYAQDNGEHVFYGAASGNANNVASQQERARFTSNGLKLPSGLGIDFSATADGSGTTTSELLDDYEEGTWTPTTSQFTHTIGANDCRYTKIGRVVHLQGTISRDQVAAPTSAFFEVTGFPFARSTNTRSINGSFWLDNGGNTVDYIGGLSYMYTTTQLIFAIQTNPAQQSAVRYVDAIHFNNTRGIFFTLTYITD